MGCYISPSMEVTPTHQRPVDNPRGFSFAWYSVVMQALYKRYNHRWLPRPMTKQEAEKYLKRV